MSDYLIISSDDFAQSAAIDAGIIRLIDAGRLSATSCLTLSPRWHEAAKLITPEIRGKADIGLHLDFTQYEQPLRRSLPALIASTALRALPAQTILESIHHQLNSFEHELGTPPNYIDGHQHVHQLPQIREALIAVLLDRYNKSSLPWLRIANPLYKDGFKAWVIAQLGSKKLATLAKKSGFKCSSQLLGVYGFEGNSADYAERLDAWLFTAKAHQGVSALMCHPAIAITADGGQQSDPIYLARLNEFEIFNDAKFVTMLQKHQIKLARGDALKLANLGG